MTRIARSLLGLVASSLLLISCAAPAPTATPTRPPEAAATATRAAATPTKAPTPTPVKVVIARSRIGLTEGVLNTATTRYFKEEGIEEEEVFTGSGAKSYPALVSGEVQFVSSTLAEGLQVIGQGAPVVFLASFQNEISPNLVLSKEVANRLGITYQSSEEAKIKALKGLRLGVSSPGAGSHLVLVYLLKKYNIDPERDVEIVSVGSAGFVPGLAASRIDAFAFGSPESDTSVARGDAIWLIKTAAGDIKEFSPLPWQGIAARKDYPEKNPDVVKRVARALVKGAKLMKENPDEAKALVRPLFQDMEAPVFEEAWKTNLPGFFDPAIAKASFDNAMRFQKAIGQEMTLTYEQAIAPTFVDDAKRELGMR